MDPPEGFDPNRGWYQHPTTGQWIPIQLSARAAIPPPEEQPEEQQNGLPPTENAPPAQATVRRGPPPPRPAFRPSSSQAHTPTFPPPPPMQSLSQHSNIYSFQPPVPVSRAPLGPELDSLFEPIPSPSPEPELEALVHSSAAQKPPKPDKGKKHTAAPEDAPSASALKKAKVTTSKAASKSTEKQPARPQGSGGHHPGSQNYTDPDLKILLRLVANVLPISGNGWARVTNQFNKWARDNNRPICTQKPLKTKFDQMARTPKPTGSAEIPPLITRAQEIDRLISGEVHMRELNDSQVDIEEEEEDLELEELEEEEEEFEIIEAPAPPKKKKAATGGPVLKTFREQGSREQGSSCSSSTTRQSSASHRAQVNDFMSAVTSSLDPAHCEAGDEAQFAHRSAQDKISRLTQDNCDLQNHYNSLNKRFQQQAFAHQQAMGEVTRLQGRLDMLEMVGAFTARLMPEIMKEGGESIGGRRIGSM